MSTASALEAMPAWLAATVAWALTSAKATVGNARAATQDAIKNFFIWVFL